MKGEDKAGHARPPRGPMDRQPPPFEILEHPADVGFRVRGATVAEVFERAALAMLSIAYDLEDAAANQQFPLAVTGPDAEALLVNWLNEVLYWADARRIAFREFHISQIDDSHVAAIGMGESRDPKRHRAKLVVKAVTYHQLKLQQTPEGWVAEVFLDV